VETMFQSLSDGVLPQDDPPTVELPYQLSHDAIIDASGRLPSKWAVPLKIMPQSFQDISGQMLERLTDSVRSFVKTLRWAQATSGTQSPFAFVGYEWSSDKVSWHAMPHSISVRIGQSRGISTTSEDIKEITEILTAAHSEPLGHELIREAFDIASMNPRSALLVGVSALETGLKDYIRLRIPHSEILLEEMPSPSVENMVQKVIPELHKAQNITTLDFPLQKDDKDLLKKWVLQRNRVTHGTQKTVDAAELIKFLEFARTLLYKLDVCSGHLWAQKFASAAAHFGQQTFNN
jgi:hypothetical protein